MTFIRIITLSSLVFLLASCLDSTETTTEYKTTSTLNLSSIDSSLDLDSVHIEVRIDGKKDTAYTLKSIQSRSLTLPPITCAEDAQIEIFYIVYSQGEIVAQGTDTYAPSEGDTDAKPIQLETSTIDKLLSAVNASSTKDGSSSVESSSTGSSTKASSNSNSSSSTPSSSVNTAGYYIAFTTASSTAIENATAGTSGYPAISLQVIGPKDGVLPEDHDITLTTSGTAKAADYTLPKTTIRIAANTAVGKTISVSLVPQQDDLVEGPETIILSLDDAKGVGPSLVNHTLTLQDADSAFVSFEQASLSLKEESDTETMGIKLITKPSTAKLAGSVTFNVSVVSAKTSAVAGTHYTAPSTSVLTHAFAAGSGDNEPYAINLSPHKIEGWNEDTHLQYKLSVTAGYAKTTSNLFDIDIVNTDYEYFAALWNNGGTFKVTLFSPKLEVISTSSINDGTSDISSVTGLILSSDKSKVYAARNSYGLYGFDANSDNWIVTSTYQGIYGIIDGGLCSDGIFSTINNQNGSTYFQTYSRTNILSGAYIDQATITSGSNPTVHYRPCIPSSTNASGGLVLAGSNLYAFLLNSPISKVAIKTDFTNATALAMLKTTSFATSEAAYVVDGTDLWTLGIYNVSYDKPKIDLTKTLGASFTGANNMIETPRNTLILFSEGMIYEINPKTGEPIRTAAHTMGSIIDADYISKGSIIATP